LSKRKKQRKRHHENQPQAFVLPAKALRHISTKLAVRTFRGHQPHRTEYSEARKPEKVAGDCQLVRLPMIFS